MQQHDSHQWSGFLPKRALVMARVGAQAEARPKLAQPGPAAPLPSTSPALSGEGDPNAQLVFVSEAPLEPKARELLDKMIVAMGLHRDQVYLCSVASDLAPGSRDPELDQQLSLLAPKIIVALGDAAAHALLETDAPVSALRGQLRPYPRRNAKLMPTYPPGHLLKNPESKRDAWSDLQAVARELGLAIPARKGT
jgi:uracil-DNA glycosylase family 4